MTENREMNLLSIINLSLEVVYCSTTLSNDDSIRLKKDSSRNYTRVTGWVLSVIHI